MEEGAEASRRGKTFLSGLQGASLCIDRRGRSDNTVQGKALKFEAAMKGKGSEGQGVLPSVMPCPALLTLRDRSMVL